MSAIDNKHLIEIIAVNEEGGITKKGPNAGNPWKMHKAQCIVRGPDNKIQIGEMLLPKEMVETTKPGKYLAEFELGINFDRLIIPRLTALHPHGDTAKPASQVPKAAV